MATSVEITPDKVWLPVTAILAALVASYTLLLAVKPALIVIGLGVMLAVKVCGPTPVT